MEEIRIDSFVMAVVLAYIGAFVHWFKVKREGRITGSFFDYLIADYPGRSMATGFAIIVATWTGAVAGSIDLVNPQLLWAFITNNVLHAPSIGAIFGAATTGYFFDSLINKGGK